jgi:iron complex outermembrane recepter protein
MKMRETKMGSFNERTMRSSVRGILMSGHVLLCAGMPLFAAQAIAGQANTATDRTASETLPEVIVTAQKRSERLQDVPVPVTALSAETLAARNQIRMQDYFAEVPGMNLTSTGSGQTSLSIRGLTAGSVAGGSPTVGVTIDDVPRGFNTAPGFSSSLYEDLDPSDLERIEVLRGPQGTLYGAASIGGLIKFVTADPSTAGFKGRAQLLVNSTDGQSGHGLRGAVNMPVSETFAVRASAFTRKDAGYVDNINTGGRGINQVDVKGGRVSALWRPSENLSLKLSAMLQDTKGDGSAEVDLALGDLQQSRMPGTEGYSQKTSLVSAIVDANLGGINLTSISAFGTFKYSHLSDQTSLYGVYAQDIFGVAGASLLDTIEPKKFSQELRLTSASGQKVEWLVGAFYTHEKTAAHQSLLANTVATGAVVGSQVEIDFPTSFHEHALFGDVTVHFSERFSTQIGARFSKHRQVYDEVDDGPLYGGIFVTPTSRTEGQANTYLLSPQWKISSDLMVYARLASGYRAGGPNAYVPGNSNLPRHYDPDKAYSYDVGIKGEIWNHTLTFDLAAYHIDWKNLQIAIIDEASGFLIHTNGGNAKSDGLELAVQTRPARGLTIALTATLGDAKLKDDLPVESTAVANAGDRLPFSSQFAGSLSVDQDFALGANWIGSVGGSLRQVGAREAEFNTSSTAIRAQLPGFSQLDLRAAARKDSWNVGLFVSNVGDKRGFIGRTPGGSSTLVPTAVYIQPRTVGFSATKEF